MTITRIAPSPTGKFHIGTARTALINYIFAKQNSGQFLLRMEDTDQERNQAEYEEDIKNGLKWLRLDWDGEIIYQSQKTDRYLSIVDQLIKQNSAYQKDGAVWFKVPKNDTIKFNDLVRGKVEFKTDDLKDFVILRSDKSPIFYLTGVVDDNDAEITHIIRGEEHLSNTPKQILIIKALGWKLPIYAHLPLILNSDRSKMSKRKDPVSISKDFKENGYLPEAMVNYLFLLGFHPKEKNPKSETRNSKHNVDIYSLKEMFDIFDILRVQKGGAVFDIEKLKSINHFYLQQIPDTELFEKLKKYQGNVESDIFTRFISIIKPRLRYLEEINQELGWLENPVVYPAEKLIFKKSDKTTTLKALNLVHTNLQKTATPEVAEIGRVFKKIIENNSLSNGDVYWSTRVALSGLEKSPPPEELIWVLGKDKSLERIEKAINKLNSK
ncbi:MAG: Glutamate-tRNA ligase [Berkelbacteria bacterium GW2011_GWA2_35_9]|uniref:Glutamate--tRNA ligase n=1 Tax=Berkelbacteria bacterium GW2011_GWA2_35_9 TaxID=1618333 RepID=A0A0G0D5X9_9BACT|nr:MAG: Glutamate-tRNA ligase [Berkelbacteria bacterium GW2011_GWA2_35_9]